MSVKPTEELLEGNLEYISNKLHDDAIFDNSELLQSLEIRKKVNPNLIKMNCTKW